jgi:hypothetical protein
MIGKTGSTMPDMSRPSFHLSQLRCLACRGLFDADLPVNVAVEVWVAATRAIRCPHCGNGPKKIGSEQVRTAAEDLAMRRPGAADASVEARAAEWPINGEIGASALTIHRHMTSPHPSANQRAPHPHDLADFNRCVLLLRRIPEWSPRMPEMAIHSPAWRSLAEHWIELAGLYEEEMGFGLDGDKAPRAHERLKQILKSSEEAGS